MKTEYPDAETMDGLRLDWADRWMLVRPSNTEPIVRAIAEANDLETAKTLCANRRSAGERNWLVRTECQVVPALDRNMSGQSRIC